MKQAWNVNKDDELAVVLGVSKQAVSSWKSRGNVPDDHIIRTAEIKKIPYDYLVNGQSSPTQTVADEPKPYRPGSEKTMLEIKDLDMLKLLSDAQYILESNTPYAALLERTITIYKGAILTEKRLEKLQAAAAQAHIPKDENQPPLAASGDDHSKSPCRQFDSVPRHHLSNKNRDIAFTAISLFCMWSTQSFPYFAQYFIPPIKTACRRLETGQPLDHIGSSLFH